MVRLEHVLDSWNKVRQDTVSAVEDFPAAEFDFRPAADVQSFREVARHILNAGHGLTALMLDGVLDFAAPSYREQLKSLVIPLPEGGTQAELAAALRQSIAERLPQLAAQPPEFYDAMMTRMDGVPLTRLEMLLTIKEHELVHRAQLFLCMRMKGIVPVTTRRRLARAASK